MFVNCITNCASFHIHPIVLLLYCLFTECEFICHKKCESRIFIKCSSKTDTEAVLQQDRTCEDLEETIELPPTDKGKQVRVCVCVCVWGGGLL